MKYSIVLCFLLVIISCQKNENKLNGDAQAIIDQSIKVSGADKYEKSTVRFDFRDKSYFANRDNGIFELGREFVQDNDTIIDSFTNSKFTRLLNNKPFEVADSMATKYTASINSVHYFSKIPNGLNDTAVNKELLEDEAISGKDYYKIKISFTEDGGGEDFEDVFIYWIDKENYKIKYLAYSYDEDDGKGMRFREAYNERYVNGIRFVDYNNYKTYDSMVSIYSLGKEFEKNKLNLLSKIELNNIEVILN